MTHNESGPQAYHQLNPASCVTRRGYVLKNSLLYFRLYYGLHICANKGHRSSSKDSPRGSTHAAIACFGPKSAKADTLACISHDCPVYSYPPGRAWNHSVMICYTILHPDIQMLYTQSLVVIHKNILDYITHKEKRQRCTLQSNCRCWVRRKITNFYSVIFHHHKVMPY